MSAIAKRLSELSLSLPVPPAPVASYVGTVISGKQLFVSGQLPFDNGALVKGHLGGDVTLEQGQAAARLCAIALLAQASAALGGDLDRISRVVKLTGFVSATSDFTDHPKVVNGASDLTVAVFGDKGKHARAAVGVSSLPLGAAVEVEAVFEIE